MLIMMMNKIIKIMNLLIFSNNYKKYLLQQKVIQRLFKKLKQIYISDWFVLSYAQTLAKNERNFDFKFADDMAEVFLFFQKININIIISKY